MRGPELLLRYAREEDAPALFALASDPEVTRFFSWGPYTDEQRGGRLRALAWRASAPTGSAWSS